MPQIISQDTTWKTGSTINIDGNVQVAVGATLTIEPGVNVVGGEIIVAGSLISSGSRLSPIIFDGTKITTSNATQLTVEFSLFKNAATVFEFEGINSTSIQNSAFVNNEVVVIDRGGYESLNIQGNIFLMNESVFYGIRTTGDSLIAGNYFSDNPQIFDGGYFFGTTTVSGNNFNNFEKLITAPVLGYGYGKVVFQDNFFSNPDSDDVAAYVLDGNDDVTLSFIQFSPAETERAKPDLPFAKKIFTFDGSEGLDTASLDVARKDATISVSKTGVVTITGRDADGSVNTLTNIELAQFTDGTLDLTNFLDLTSLSTSQFSDLAKVYVAYFNRAADAEGLYFWADKLAEGMDMPTIASYFSQSAEAKALYPDTADTSAFVTAVYANVLGRTPDQAGFDFWTTNLNNGTMQPATFVLSIIGGAQGPDITYLSNKADLGVYFAAIKGMSDVTDAQNVLNIFGDQATSNTAGAKASVDGHYADATASGGGEFIFELVGIVNDPFAGVI